MILDSFDKNVKILLDSKSILENKVRIVEELGELSHEILKDTRGKLNRENLLEEFADVIIELHMLKEIYQISENEIDKVVNDKMKKDLNRLKNKEV